MGTLLDSVNNLSDKLGITAREQTIKDQLDLCVERLGGEGNSVDIAESANKFADKEDGTATFTTKTVTENGTYDAIDDGVSGYSSVTVDISGGGGSSDRYYENLTIPGKSVTVLTPTDGNDTFDVKYKTPWDYHSDGISPYFLTAPAKKIVNLGANPSFTIYFTPSSDFEGFYNSTSERSIVPAKELSGDTIVPGDGKVYTLNTSTWSIEKSNITYQYTKEDLPTV